MKTTAVCSWGLAAAMLAAPLMGSAGCAGIGTPKVIYLARHGQTEWNRVSRLQGDPDLDAVGYLNRVSLWMLLRDQPLVAIYTSAARRTQRTAALIARHKQLKIQPWPAINEIQPGVLEGICYALLNPERAAKSPESRQCVVAARGSRPQVILPALRKLTAKSFGSHSLTTRVPQGESYQDLLDRTAPFIDHLRRRHVDGKVLIVAHGVINRILLHRLLGWSIEQVRKLRQENDQVYRIEGAGTASPHVALYTPGVGWKRCSAPRPGDKRLDCAPEPTVTSAEAMLSATPAAAPAPTAPAPTAPSPTAPSPTAPGFGPAAEPEPATPSQPTP